MRVPEKEYCKSTQCVQAASSILAAMDPEAQPCTDFFQYACGKWVRQNPIPKGYHKWDRVQELSGQNLYVLKSLIGVYKVSRAALWTSVGFCLLGPSASACSPPLGLFPCLFLCLCSTFLSASLRLSVSVYLSVCVCLCRCLSLCLYLSLSLSLSVNACVFLFVSFCLSDSLSLFLCVCVLSVCVCVCV